MSDPVRRLWPRDLVLWLGALFGAGAQGYVLFAGRYVPYIDWAGHVGLISVLAQGDATGASAYFDTNWLPLPYLIYYALTALIGQFVAVAVAAKLSLVLIAFLTTLAAAELAEVCGRSPRLALLAPLTLFGYALGFGFVTFLAATPFAIFTIASAERLVQASLPIETKLRDLYRPLLRLAVSFVLLYLAHGMFFLAVAAVIGFRLVFSFGNRLRQRRPLLPLLGAMALTTPPIIALAALALWRLRSSHRTETSTSSAGEWAFPTLAERMNFLPVHLLKRDNMPHEWTMYAVAGFAVVVALLWFVRQLRLQTEERSRGLYFYALGFVLLYLTGPNSLVWPLSVWVFYSRFATIAVLLLIMLPRVDLTRRGLAPLLLVPLAILAYNAHLQAHGVERISKMAEPYNKVRALIPKSARLLAINSNRRGDLTRHHQALTGLHFYHLSDGTAYGAFLFDHPLLSVRPKLKGRPRAPYWRKLRFDPKTHGKDYDYFVIRDAYIPKQLDRNPQFERIADISGWVVFKNREPPPWPPLTETSTTGTSTTPKI